MRIRTCIAGILAILAASLAHAATTNERSPFVQGNWWNPARSGSGFEIFNSADQVMVLWYTYDDAGRPTWYTAQGDVSSIGTTAWPLLQHRWVNGRKAEPATVGSLKLAFRNVQSADVSFTIGGSSGTWPIEPFVASAMMKDVDHSGSWFDPSNSGWGLTVIQQGDVLGGALFTYDAAGNPTWLSGFDRGVDTIEYFSYTGSCPTCAYRPFTTQSAGRIAFDFHDEYHATLRASLAIAMAPGVAIDNANVMQFSRPMSFRAVDRQLANFAGDAPLKAFLDAGMLNLGPVSNAGFSASPAPSFYSTTNLQESGVDEADVAKSNGSSVFTFAYDASGARIPSLRIASIGVDGTAIGPIATIPLSSGPQTPVAYAGLYVDGDTLVSVVASQPVTFGPSPLAMPPVTWSDGKTYVEIFGAATATPQSRWRAEIDGHFVASRRIGRQLYVVTRHVPHPAGFMFGAAPGSTGYAANQQLLAALSARDLLPAIRLNGGAPVAALGPSTLYVPPQGERPAYAQVALVTAIDLDNPGTPRMLGIASNIDTVYVSSANMYVVSSRYAARNASGVMLPTDLPGASSDIHQVRLGAGAMSIVASGSVDGVVGYDLEKAPFHLSEESGRLRVLSSSNSAWGVDSKNRLTVLEPSATVPGTLKTLAYIPNARQPDPLGKPGEVLYGARFAGYRMYAVTFKKIDPLYVVDLSDAAAPRIAGALEMPGFSDYLHPLPGNLLLGFGKEAVPAGLVADGQFAWYQGLMLALYDVSNPSAPRELDRAVIGKRGSDSALLHDHHALSVLAQDDGSTSVAFPARIHTGATVSADPSHYYPWAASGLVRYQVRGAGASAVLAPMPSLFTSTAEANGTLYNDAATSNARSVLFRFGTIYVANGQFWRQDAAGNSAGPF